MEKKKRRDERTTEDAVRQIILPETSQLRLLIFAWEQSLEATKIFLLHGTKTKMSFDAMKLSPFCKLHLIAKSIGSLMI